MKFRKIIPMILHAGQQRDTDVKNRLLDSMGGECGMIWKNSIKTYTLPYVI